MDDILMNLGDKECIFAVKLKEKEKALLEQLEEFEYFRTRLSESCGIPKKYFGTEAQ